MLKIFATDQFISSDSESPDKRGLFGAWVARDAFYRNLLRFGNFNEYHFFVLPENRHKRNLFSGNKPSSYNDKKEKMRRIIDLPLFLKNTENTIFFTPNPAIFNIANLRSIYASRYLPICGLTHAVSYAVSVGQVFFYNLASDIQPFDSIVCTSKSALESVRKIHNLISKNISGRISGRIKFKARLDQIPLGINTEGFLKNDKNESRKRLRLPAKKIALLYFGRFSISDKADLYPLLLVFKNLLRENKNILLILAGKNFQGNYGERVKRMTSEMGISASTKFFFNPSQKEKYLLYVASDIFVSPADNLQESFGLTVLEAMASALPTVVSDWDGYRDMVTHGKTGFLIPTYWTNCSQMTSDYTYLFRGNLSLENLSLGQSVCVDVKKMTEYLSLLIKRKDLRLGFGYNARKEAVKNYDWSAIIPKYEALWDMMIYKAKKYRVHPRGTPIFYPQYFECFNHYPSSILNKRMSIAITKEGIHLLKTREFPSEMPPLNLIQPQIALLILFYLKERHTSNIEDIRHHINKFFKEIQGGIISYHIMWVLKKHLAILVSK